MSFRQIAETMDSVSPARSIRELADHHRWSSGAPPSPLSLRSIIDRHDHPQKVTQNFLFYNTFLMPEITISILEFIDFSTPAKPALEARSREIGIALASNFDIAALCEVFSENERNRIRDGYPLEHRLFEAVGPDVSGTIRIPIAGAFVLPVVLSSGLFTLSRLPTTGRSPTLIFRERGSAQRDADVWANRGVLLTEIDLGLPVGRLEIFSTHMFAGGTGGEGPIPGPSEDEASIIRLNQVEELVRFVRTEHQRQNVAIVVGDFNISATSAAYTELNNIMTTELEMDDLWEIRNNTFGFTSNIAESGRAICSGALSDLFCDDAVSPSDTGSRIDYIFVERQKPDHGFMLDFTRPRRVPFERDPSAAGLSDIGFMSDHIGLAVSLIATPL